MQIVANKVRQADKFMLDKKIYQVACLLFVLVVSLFLINSFNKIVTYSNYAQAKTSGIRMEENQSVSFAFEAKKSKLSSLSIYKDMKKSRLDASDTLDITFFDASGKEIFSKQAFLYHPHRNYVTVDLNSLRLRSGQLYTVQITVKNLSKESVLYLETHSINTFSQLDEESPDVDGKDNSYDIPIGYTYVPNISYHYSMLSPLSLFVHLLVLLIAVLLLFFNRLIKSRLFRETYRVFGISLFLYLVLEILNVARDDSLQFLFPFNWRFIFIITCGIAIIVIIYAVLLFILGRGTIAMLITSTIVFAIGYTNHAKIVMRGDPFMPWDIYAAGIAAKVSSKYDFRITVQFVASLFMVAIILIMIRLTHCEKIRKRKIRIIGIVGSIALAVSFSVGIIMNVGLHEKMNISYPLYPPLESYNENGTIFSFFLHLNNINAKGETDNSPQLTADIISKYAQMAEDMNLDNNVAEHAVQPNVICIMSESYGDLRSIRNIETSEALMPFFDSLKKNTMYGDLQVSVFAGGTCNTEFEFLTGFSVSGLLAGSSVYTFYVDEEVNAMPAIFKSEGYKTIAIHPFDSQWWDRETAYPLLGFDEFISREDFSEPYMVRQFISDKSAFERIIEEYEKSEDEGPIFTFCVTIQNHADFSKRWENESYDLKIENFEDYDFPYAENYFSLLRESDDALKDLIGYFQNVDEPTIIVFFGDHLPQLDYGFYDALLDTDISKISASESLPMYATPYFIWANYELPVGYQGKTSPNFLGQTILDLAGIESPDDRACLRVLQTQISAISSLAIFDLEGSPWMSTENMSEDILKVLQDYERIQYGSIYYKDDELFPEVTP
jgi:phosphoglycerol transferase MdoB-like AlkP superfamily enzyme